MKAKQNNRRYQKIYYQSNATNRELFPHIRIAGKYLKGFDFNVGDTIEVNIEKGKMTVTKICSATPPIVKPIVKESKEVFTQSIELMEARPKYNADNTERTTELKNVRQNKTKSKELQR